MRDDQGRFVSGTSGNPGGRPRPLAELRDLIEPLLPDLVATLADIASDPTQPGRARVMAVKELFDRCLGRAPRAREWLPPEEPTRQCLAERDQPGEIDPEPSAPPAEPEAEPVTAPAVVSAAAAPACKTPVLRPGTEPSGPLATSLFSGTALSPLDPPEPAATPPVLRPGLEPAPCKTPVLRSAFQRPGDLFIHPHPGRRT